MGYKCLFLSNETYSAEDVNTAFSRLTAQGVSLFNDTGNPLMDLNTAISQYVEPGVGLYNNDACKVTVSGGVYKVSEGTIWLSDGTSIVVNGDGHELDVKVGTVQYVYAVSQPVVNSAAIVISSIEGGANTVPLATISANGTIADTRVFATTKVAPVGGNLYITRIVNGIHIDYSTSLTLDFGWSGFTKITCGRKGLGPYTLSVTDFLLGDNYVRIHDITSPTSGFRTANITKSGSLVTLTRRSENISLNEDYVFEVM